ncbi:MAG: hypothetical protein HDT23_06065 [Ruminococcus sp.]|nr:hypothetical protein [Ruminococcus sp.]
MNTLIKTLVCIVLSIVTVFCTTFQVYALDFDPCQIYLYTDNTPENTAYIDILVPLNKNNDSYVDFTNPPLWYMEDGENKPLFIDKNSQIAQYNDNGYSSLSLHTEYVRTMEVYDGNIYFTDTIDNIYKKYKNFKAVYVDANGNILEITDKFSVQYNAKKPYAFIVNNNHLILRIFGINPFTTIICITIFFVSVLLFLILLIIFIIRQLQKKKIRK